MNMKIEEAQPYAELFDSLQTQFGDTNVALSVMHELSKDRRMALIREERSRMWTPAPTSNGVRDGDSPATEKQKAYLKRLGVDVPASITKQAASQLIDEHAA